MTMPPVPAVPPTRTSTLTYIDSADLANYTNAWQTRDAAQQARIAELEAQIPAPTTVFGIDLSDLTGDKPLSEAQKVNAHRALGLKLTNVRVFDGSGLPDWTSERIKALDPTKGDSILISSLTTDIAGMTTALKNTPDEWRGRVRVSHGHEREADLLSQADPDAAVKAWLDGNARKADMLDSLGSYGYSSDDLVKILLWYSQVIDTRYKGTQEKFYGGQNFGMWGMDCYHNAAWLNQQDRYATPQELFDPVLDFAAQIGRPVCIPEWGATLAKTDTNGARRAQSVSDGGAYLRSKDAVFANWWCGTGKTDSTQPEGYRNFHLEKVAGASSPELQAYLAL